MPPKKINIKEYATHLDNKKNVLSLTKKDNMIKERHKWRGAWAIIKNIIVNRTPMLEKKII